MNIEKMIALTFEELKNLIRISQKLGRKSEKDFSDLIIQRIDELNSLSEKDFIKETEEKKIYTKKSPVHYRWIIPDE